MNTQRGTVKTLVRADYGFITADHGGDYFFHRSVLAEGQSFSELHEGDRVEFGEEQPSPRGQRATAVRAL